ncbi:MAG: helix-turn-helix transcriptional regulator, partial [Psychrosphaera sp.]|nr:helix-turn-helix transcriptional regulator [Psychrosphaera sp.]
EPIEVEANNAHQLFSEQVNQVLENHYHDESFGVKQFAAQMHSSERNFVRKMSTLLDIKPNKVLRIFRLRKAAELLIQGTPSSQVTVKVGFGSHSYFSQCFKAQYDCLPSQYPHE